MPSPKKKKQELEEEIKVETEETEEEEASPETEEKVDTKEPKKEEAKEEEAAPEEKGTEEPDTGELDLGLDGEETEEVEAVELDMESAMSKLKPDFGLVVTMLGLSPIAGSQEELETALLTKQKEFEQFLAKTLVPKIKAALGLANAPADKKAEAAQKPGVEGQKTEERKRKTTPRQLRK